MADYFHDPDLPALRAFVEKGEMKPVDAIEQVIIQWTEQPSDHETAPNIQDPELWLLIGVCVKKSAIQNWPTILKIIKAFL